MCLLETDFLSNHPKLEQFFAIEVPTAIDAEKLEATYDQKIKDKNGNICGYDTFPPAIVAIIIGKPLHFQILFRQLIEEAYHYMIVNDQANHQHLITIVEIMACTKEFDHHVWIANIIESCPDPDDPLEFICTATRMVTPPVWPTAQQLDEDKENDGSRIPLPRGSFFRPRRLEHIPEPLEHSPEPVEPTTPIHWNSRPNPHETNIPYANEFSAF